MLHHPDLRLVLPDAASAAPVHLDPTQRSALEAARTEPVTLVVGAPGTGKTTVAIEVAAQALSEGADPARVLVIAASRRSAAEVRDRLSARADRTVSAPMVRTAAAAAFAVLRARAAAVGEPPPTLISGPEQDLLLAELLAGHLDGDGCPAPAGRAAGGGAGSARPAPGAARPPDARGRARSDSRGPRRPGRPARSPRVAVRRAGLPGVPRRDRAAGRDP
ncbi:UvrD-helicase domain-containing protein [Oerskovia sp. M15]